MTVESSSDGDHISAEWVYANAQAGMEGVFPPLVNELSTEVTFDKVKFEYDRTASLATERPWNRRCVMALRRGIYGVLRINLVREVGRTIVRLRIMKQSDVRRVLVICREHFDAWFKVTPEESAGPCGKKRDMEAP